MHFDHELLLVPNHHSRPANAHPRDEGFRLKLVVVHDVAPNQSPCATKACAAVNGDCLSSVDVVLSDLNELTNDWVFGVAAIGELHFVDSDFFVLEGVSAVHFVVESHNPLYVQIQKLVAYCFSPWRHSS